MSGRYWTAVVFTAFVVLVVLYAAAVFLTLAFQP